MYPKPIYNLIRAFGKLPSVGPRTAERFVFHLLKSGKKEVADLGLALQELMINVKSCSICWDFSDHSPCTICSDKRRDISQMAIVTESQDVQTLEKVGIYRGLYHVLRGTIARDAGDQSILKLNELYIRLRKNTVSEIILALSPNIEGEMTMMMIEQEVKQSFPTIKISRLARGLPSGSELQYADEITLENAFKSRTVVK
jgi:recombination protein RecR